MITTGNLIILVVSVLGIVSWIVATIQNDQL